MKNKKRNFCSISGFNGFTCGAPSTILSSECRYYKNGESIWCKFNKVGQCKSIEAKESLDLFLRSNIVAKWNKNDEVDEIVIKDNGVK